MWPQRVSHGRPHCAHARVQTGHSAALPPPSRALGCASSAEAAPFWARPVATVRHQVRGGAESHGRAGLGVGGNQRPPHLRGQRLQAKVPQATVDAADCAPHALALLAHEVTVNVGGLSQDHGGLAIAQRQRPARRPAPAARTLRRRSASSS